VLAGCCFAIACNLLAFTTISPMKPRPTCPANIRRCQNSVRLEFVPSLSYCNPRCPEPSCTTLEVAGSLYDKTDTMTPATSNMHTALVQAQKTRTQPSGADSQRVASIWARPTSCASMSKTQGAPSNSTLPEFAFHVPVCVGWLAHKNRTGAMHIMGTHRAA
jgi:hypothetical protein